MTEIITDNINSILNYRARIFWIFTLSIIALTFVYASLVHSTIINVLEREKLIGDIRDKSTLVSELESSYFSIKNKINIDLAHSKGFYDSEISSFISKKSLTAFVSNNEF